MSWAACVRSVSIVTKGTFSRPRSQVYIVLIGSSNLRDSKSQEPVLIIFAGASHSMWLLRTNSARHPPAHKSASSPQSDTVTHCTDTQRDRQKRQGTEECLLSCTVGPVSTTFSQVPHQYEHSSYHRQPDIHALHFQEGGIIRAKQRGPAQESSQYITPQRSHATGATKKRKGVYSECLNGKKNRLAFVDFCFDIPTVCFMVFKNLDRFESE